RQGPRQPDAQRHREPHLQGAPHRGSAARPGGDAGEERAPDLPLAGRPAGPAPQCYVHGPARSRLPEDPGLDPRRREATLMASKERPESAVPTQVVKMKNTPAGTRQGATSQPKLAVGSSPAKPVAAKPLAEDPPTVETKPLAEDPPTVETKPPTQETKPIAS